VGGAEIDLLRKSRELIRRHACEMTICCLRRRGELAGRAERDGVRVLGPWMRHRFDPRGPFRLRRLLREGEWDIVHSHLFAANVITGLLLERISEPRRYPWVASEHALAELRPGVVRSLYRRLERVADLWLVPSEAARGSYASRGLDARRWGVLANAIEATAPSEPAGVSGAAGRTEGSGAAKGPCGGGDSSREETRRELGIPADATLLATVCRLERVKDLPVLLDAVRPLAVRLLVIGEGPERSALERQVRDAGMGAQVCFTGTRGDVPRLLRACDLFVSSSRSESFGMAIAEALSCGLPVVATAVGAVPEITRRGELARLTPPGDAAAMRAAIREAIERPEETRRRAQAGAEHVARAFDPTALAGEQDRIYRELIRRRAGASSTSAAGSGSAG
jgi:glycosyltransferase involved in cell wall biosynthesis